VAYVIDPVTVEITIPTGRSPGGCASASAFVKDKPAWHESALDKASSTGLKFLGRSG